MLSPNINASCEQRSPLTAVVRWRRGKLGKPQRRTNVARAATIARRSRRRRRQAGGERQLGDHVPAGPVQDQVDVRVVLELEAVDLGLDPVGCTNSVVGRNPRDLQRNRICAPQNNRRRPGRLDGGTTADQPRLTSVVRTASSSWAWRFSGGQRKSSSGWAAESSVPSRPFRLAPERTRRPRSPNRPVLTLAACRSFHDEVSPWKHRTGRSKPGERGNTSTTRRPRVGFSLSASRAVRSRATSPSERSALGGDKTDRSAHFRQR